jgi:hypothetical protein
LLALIEEHDSALERLLAERGTSGPDILADLRRALGTGDDRSWDGILITPRIRSVVARAEAALENGALVEPVNLLEALLAEDGGLAADVLERRAGNSSVPSRVAG